MNNYKKYLLSSAFSFSLIASLSMASHLHSSYSFLDEAYEDSGQYDAESVRRCQFAELGIGQPEDISSEQKETNFTQKLQGLIDNLARIQKIREFDPDILKDPSEQSSLVSLQTQISKFDDSFIRKLLDFYSEDSETRNFAYGGQIRDPLLDILGSVTKMFHMLPQSFSHLASPNLRLSPLLNVAIKDIFSQDTQGLKALKKALKEIRDNEGLSTKTEKQLILFKKVAGYYYDETAIGYLIKSLGDSLSLLSAGDTRKEKLAILRIIQITGELLKPVLPSALRLDERLPNPMLLLRLRSQLAHLTPRRLRGLLGEKNTQLFINLKKDFAQMGLFLKELPSKMPPKPLDETEVSALWQGLKSEDEAKSKQTLEEWVKQEDGNWLGFKGLYKFFNPVSVQAPLDEKEKEKENNDKKKQKVKAKIATEDPQLQKLQKCQQYFQKIMAKEELLKEEGEELNELCQELKIDRDQPVSSNLDFLRAHINQITLETASQFVDYSSEIEDFLPWDLYKKKIDDFGEKWHNEKKKLKDARLRLKKLYICQQYVQKIMAKQDLPNEDEQKFNKLCKELKIVRKDAIEKNVETLQEPIKLLEQNDSLKQLYELWMGVDQETNKIRKKELTLQARKAEDEVISHILNMSGAEIEDLERKKNLQKSQQKLAEKLRETSPLRGWRFQDKLSELLDLINDERKKAGLSLIDFKYDWLAEPDNAHQPHEARQFERFFYKVQGISFPSLLEKNKHRSENVHSLLGIIDLLREESNIDTDVRLEQFKRSFKMTLNGKLGIMSNAFHSLKSKEISVEEALPHLQEEDSIQEILTLKQHLEEATGQDAAISYLKGKSALCKELSNIMARTTMGKMASVRFRGVEPRREENIVSYLIKNKAVVENFLKEKLNSLLQAMVKSKKEELQKYLDELISIRDKIAFFKKEDLEKAKIRIEELKHEFINCYEKFYEHPLLQSDHPSTLREQLLNQNLANKRSFIEQLLLQNWLLSNPLDDYFGLIEQIRGKFSDKDPLNVAAHEFLVGFFYECLKEISDYPELTSLKSTVKLRNHYNHKSISDTEAPNIPGRLTTYLSEDGSLAQDVAVITINIKFILESLIQKLMWINAEASLLQNYEYSGTDVSQLIRHNLLQEFKGSIVQHFTLDEGQVASDYEGADLMIHRLGNRYILPPIYPYQAAQAQALDPYTTLGKCLTNFLNHSIVTSNLPTEIIIPFNSGSHWVTLRIVVNHNEIGIEYIDSLYHEESEINEVKKEHVEKGLEGVKKLLKDHFNREVKVAFLTARIQPDWKACGVLVVENINDLMRGQNLPLSSFLNNEEIRALRMAQRKLLQDASVDLDVGAVSNHNSHKGDATSILDDTLIEQKQKVAESEEVSLEELIQMFLEGGLSPNMRDKDYIFLKNQVDMAKGKVEGLVATLNNTFFSGERKRSSTELVAHLSALLERNPDNKDYKVNLENLQNLLGDQENLYSEVQAYCTRQQIGKEKEEKKE